MGKENSETPATSARCRIGIHQARPVVVHPVRRREPARKISLLSQHGESRPYTFIFDEPTTGLHFHDIRKLLEAFDALIRRGHSIVIIEHNMDVVKCADHVIDLGPEGGDKGGYIVATGTPEEVAACAASYTGQFLKEKLQ